MTDKRLTVAQVAKRMGVDPETVRRWIRQKKIQAARVGRFGKYRIPESALNQK